MLLQRPGTRKQVGLQAGRGLASRADPRWRRGLWRQRPRRPCWRCGL